MELHRLDDNPLLTPEDLLPTQPDVEVMCTLNPGAVRHAGQTLLLVRVGERPVPEKGYVSYLRFHAATGRMQTCRIPADDPDLVTLDGRGYFHRGRMVLSSLSHLRIARSTDGRHFAFDPAPAILPASPYEAFGVEDARITPIDGRYLITYTAVSDRGVCVAMSSTTDWSTFEHHGLIFPPFQKDVCIFPEKVGGLHVCRHRPYQSQFNRASIWTAWSPDLLSWGRHSMTLAPTPETWEAGRVGCGAPPILTDAGWLEIYHAADAEGRYALGAMLSDLDYPETVIARSRRPVLRPEAPYERTGIYGNCVFSNGLVVEDDGTMVVYYGAADRICAAAVTTVEEMIAAAKNEA